MLTYIVELRTRDAAEQAPERARLSSEPVLFVSCGLLAQRLPFVELGVVTLEAEKAAVEFGEPDHERKDRLICLEGFLARDSNKGSARWRADRAGSTKREEHTLAPDDLVVGGIGDHDALSLTSYTLNLKLMRLDT